MSVTNNNYTIIYNFDGYNIINNDNINEIDKIDKIYKIDKNIIENNKSCQNDKNLIKVIKKPHTYVSELPVDKLADYLHR